MTCHQQLSSLSGWLSVSLSGWMAERSSKPEDVYKNRTAFEFFSFPFFFLSFPFTCIPLLHVFLIFFIISFTSRKFFFLVKLTFNSTHRFTQAEWRDERDDRASNSLFEELWIHFDTPLAFILDSTRKVSGAHKCRAEFYIHVLFLKGGSLVRL